MNKNKLKKFLVKILGIGIIITASVFYFSLHNSVQSSSLDNISGYAWAGDYVDNNPANGSQDLPNEETGGMGWLSFNCVTGGNCGNVDYGLNVDNSNNIVGYAWSSNYGWLKFGGLFGFPTGGGTTPSNAKLTGAEVKGWARFCSVAGNPDSCTGDTLPNITNGGWDGWVSLSGVSPDYGVTLSGSVLSGFAWGGNDNGKNVVGWIDFSDVDYVPIAGPVVTISADPSSVPVGGSTIISWEGIGLIESSTGCNATGGTGSWPGAKSSPSGSFTTGILPNGTYNYSIQCLGADGITLSNVSTVIVNVGVTSSLDFYADPAVAYPPNYKTILFWNAVPSSPGFTNCVADSSDNPAPVPSWDGNIANPPSFLSVSAPYDPTSYTLVCEDQFGEDVFSTIYVPRGTLPESVSLSSNGVTGISPDFTTTLSWSTLNATSCIASASVPGTGWDTPASKADNGSQPGVIVPESSPAYTTYTLTCVGVSGEQIQTSIQLNESSEPVFNTVLPYYKEN
jgi:hypothetical protein